MTASSSAPAGGSPEPPPAGATQPSLPGYSRKRAEGVLSHVNRAKELLAVLQVAFEPGVADVTPLYDGGVLHAAQVPATATTFYRAVPYLYERATALDGDVTRTGVRVWWGTWRAVRDELPMLPVLVTDTATPQQAVYELLVHRNDLATR